MRERSLLRQLIRVSGEIAGSCYEAEGRPAHELVDDAERRIFQIAEKGRRQGSGFVPVKDVLGATIDRLDLLHASQGQLTGISTGYAELDKMTAGLQPGDLIIVAGRPSMGKTTLRPQHRARTPPSRPTSRSRSSRWKCRANSSTFRMISSLGRVDQGHMRTGNFGDEDWAAHQQRHRAADSRRRSSSTTRRLADADRGARPRATAGARCEKQAGST